MKEKLPKTEIPKTEEQWRETLTPEQYRVMRDHGTEAPFTGAYVDNHAEGMYECAGCGNPLFASLAKFDSGTGWPSFACAIGDKSVRASADDSLGMSRTEVRCTVCDAHLGHVFPDGPPPTGQRYCMNSVALKFVPGKDKA